MNIIGKLEYWQDEWVPSFKYRCYLSWIKSWCEAPSAHEGAKVILSDCLPIPNEAITGNSGKWYRHILLSLWIKEY